MNPYEAAINQQRLADLGHEANETKLKQLIVDAGAKITTASEHHDHDVNIAYWKGVEFGLRRALNVLQGKG
jgi:hypothetical protein